MSYLPTAGGYTGGKPGPAFGWDRAAYLRAYPRGPNEPLERFNWRVEKATGTVDFTIPPYGAGRPQCLKRPAPSECWSPDPKQQVAESQARQIAQETAQQAAAIQQQTDAGAAGTSLMPLLYIGGAVAAAAVLIIILKKKKS